MEQRLVNYNTHTHTLSLMSRLRLESIWQAVKSVSEGVKHIKGGVRLGVRASGCACMLPLGPLACKNKRSYSRFKAFFFLSVFFFGFFVSPCNHQTRDGQLYEQTMRCDDVVCRMWRGVGRARTCAFLSCGPPILCPSPPTFEEDEAASVVVDDDDDDDEDEDEEDAHISLYAAISSAVPFA